LVKENPTLVLIILVILILYVLYLSIDLSGFAVKRKKQTKKEPDELDSLIEKINNL
jgi:hypothetical protein